MGDFRITIEAVGGHGCGRGIEATGPEGKLRVARCLKVSCPDCMTQEFVQRLRGVCCQVLKAELAHWPVPGAAGTTRTESPGPIDNLLDGTRDKRF